MTVILFYAALICAIALIFASYAALLLLPIGMIAHRFGIAASAAYAAMLALTMYAFFEPPYGGMSLGFAPAGMQANLFIVGLFQDPPVSMLIATSALSIAGLVAVLIAWVFRRA